MIIRAVLKLSSVLLFLLFSGCVTTTIGPYEDKKDLSKAEETYIQIGYGYFEKGNLLEAKRSLIRALEIDDRSAGAHMGLARVYDRELEYDLADDHFKKAIRYGGNTEAHFQYGVYLYNRGEFKDAYRQFDTVLEDTVYVRRAQTFEYQGIVASRLDRNERAITYYKRAIALNAVLANSYIGLTNIYNEQQDYQNAYVYYSGFVKLVQAQLARHNASTLWLGIQLADELGDDNALSSFTLQLRNRFKESPEYQQYLKWQADKDAA
jgi:type IV pilus assembly protein PilF